MAGSDEIADETLAGIERAVEKLKLGGSRRHIFLCVGGKCAPREQQLASWEYLKRRLRELGLDQVEGNVLRTKADCLRICIGGPSRSSIRRGSGIGTARRPISSGSSRST